MTQRISLVTGAGRGIGAAIVHRLAADGDHVIVTDVHEAAAAAVADSVGGEHLVLDVSDAEAVDATVDDVVARFGHLDVLVNNAGILGLSSDVLHRAGDNLAAAMEGRPPQPVGATSRLSDEAWDAVLQVHLYGTFHATRAALRHMEPARSGAIVNLASIYGLAGNPLDPAYAVAKGGIVQLTRSVGGEVAPLGIRVNAVAPGFVDTALLEHVPDVMKAMVVQQTPAGRMGTPAEVAEAVAFLASERASFCFGEVLTVSGGWAAT